MDSENAKELLTRLGCRRIRLSRKQISCSCPFVENHEHGDRHPSFSAAISEDSVSPFLCFSCHETGVLENLAVKNGYSDLVLDWKPKRIDGKSWINYPSTNVGKFRHLYLKKEVPVLFEDKHLSLFKGVLSAYLKKRGITLDTAREWELGFDKQNKRAIFIVREYEGRLAFIIGRDVTGKSRVKYSNYVFDKLNQRMEPFIDHKRESDFISPTKSYFLYGEDKAWNFLKGKSERKNKDLIVVEGPLDVLNLWQSGWNVIGIMGSMPSDSQIEKIIMMTPRDGRLIVMGDGDKAGRKMAKNLVSKVGQRLPVYKVMLDEGKDPGDLTQKEIDEVMKKISLIGLTMFE